MILAILGILDIAAGISLVFPNFLVFYLGIIILIKAIFSIVGSLASKFFLFVSFIDLIVGLMLLFSFSIPFFWVFPVIKGTYSLITGMTS